jgi:hypothetical protein
MYLQVLAQSEVLSVRLKSLTTCWRVTVDPDVGQHVLQFINADSSGKCALRDPENAAAEAYTLGAFP